MPVKITKRERERVYLETEKIFEPPKTNTGKFLFSLAEYAGALSSRSSYRYISLSALVDIRRGKKFRSEYQKKMRVLYALKQQKLIETEKKGDELFVCLTKKGWAKFVSEGRYRKARRLPPNEGCFVSFDIPEDLRYIRQAVRAELKRAEFKLVHHSLWKSRYDVSAELASAIREAGAGHWVKIFVGREITS